MISATADTQQPAGHGGLFFLYWAAKGSVAIVVRTMPTAEPLYFGASPCGSVG
jgi:hypothetical protein